MVEKGFSKTVAPVAVLVFNSPSVIGTLIIGTLVDRFGARRVLVPSFLLLAASLALLSSASGFSTVLLLLGLTGFLLLSANYALYGIAAQQYPLAGRGTGSGAAVAVGRKAGRGGGAACATDAQVNACHFQLPRWLARCTCGSD